jgi:hypothetical protein
VINRKAVFGSIVAAAVATTACYGGLIWPAISVAVVIRRKMPNACFAGLIVFYAMLAVAVVSVAIEGVAYWMVYKHATRSTVKPQEPE